MIHRCTRSRGKLCFLFTSRKISKSHGDGNLAPEWAIGLEAWPVALRVLFDCRSVRAGGWLTAIHAAPFCLPFGGPLAHSYDIIADRVIIHAKGYIALDEANAVNTWRHSLSVESQKAMKIGHITVALDSPGGSIAGAEDFMQWVKDNKIDTIVPNGATCASACVMIWGAAAGDRRTGWQVGACDRGRTERARDPTPSGGRCTRRP
jgi:hypothetical protein